MSDLWRPNDICKTESPEPPSSHGQRYPELLAASRWSQSLKPGEDEKNNPQERELYKVRGRREGRYQMQKRMN